MYKKIINKLILPILKLIEIFNSSFYISLYPKYLHWLGVNIDPHRKAGYISPSVDFDGNDYSLIKIGSGTTISKNVMLLTHDYSIKKGLFLKGIDTNARFLKNIEIGNNCFIGARSCILPGTKIGDNVIVGAGSVIKGIIPNNCIIIGNPAKIVTNIEKWTDIHIQKKDYIE